MITFEKPFGYRILELGGGDRRHPQADVMCDYRFVEGVTDFNCDFTQPLPVGDADFDVVYSAYALEHLPYPAVPAFLREVFRILKPGGKAVFIIPDTEAQMRWVLEHPDGWDGKDLFLAASEKLFGDQRHGERRGDSNPAVDSHKAYFSPKSATALFSTAGFTDVSTTPYGERKTDMVVQGSRPRETQAAQGGPFVHVGSEPPPAVSTPQQQQQPYSREQLFDKHYFNGGGKVGGYHPSYWDFPCHEITARHILARRPESVLELGCARGYVLKRLEDHGVCGVGLDISRHCYLTRAAERVLTWDLCKTPWSTLGDQTHDLCYSVGVLDHIPEERLDGVIKEMVRTSRRGLHGINFALPDPSDRTRCTTHDKGWWERLFAHCAPGWPVEVVSKDDLENGDPPPELYYDGGKVKLNLGSHTIMFHRGWANIDQGDLDRWSQQHHYKYIRHDLRNGIPFGTATVDLIYSSHFLEHLSYTEGLSLLRECRRVIKPTGAMRLIVPDVGKLIYQHMTDFSSEGGGGEPMSVFHEVNDECENAPTSLGKLHAMIQGSDHRAFYDAETLAHLLRQVGFEPHPSSFRDDRTTSESLKQMRRETVDTFPEHSLFVNAVPRMDV